MGRSELTLRTYEGMVEVDPKGTDMIMAFNPDEATEMGYRLIELADSVRAGGNGDE